MTVDLAAYAQDPAAAQTLSWMKDGRWRKARDAAKELVKRDRTRYLPLLVEANVGLTREMLGKGLVKEATTVVDYLASIAPPARVASLRAELAAPVVKRSAPDPAKADAAGWWDAAVRVDLAMGTATAMAAPDLAAIDLLVTDGFVPPVAAGDAQALRLAQELAAVRAACNATGDGRWEVARDALQGLPRQSVFRHWRLFLRGVRCVFEDQWDTARQCFADLPPEGALARAARAFNPALVPAGPLAPASARVPLYLAASGQPAAWSGPILAAAAAWKAGKRTEPFDELLVGLKGEFPAFAGGLPAVLTEVALPYRARMGEADYAAADTLIDRLGLERGGKKLQSPAAVLAVMRPMCLADVGAVPPGTLDRSWRRVIDLWNQCEGPNPARDSVAWHWLGEALSHSAADSKGHFQNYPPDFDKARKALERAVECDPTHETAALALLALLHRQRDTKAHRRLQDDLLARFPANKSLRLGAATQALERKAFDKALANFQVALELDPLDKNIKSDMLVALVQQTREWLGKKRPVAAQWAAMEPLLEDRPPAGCFMLSRWLARVRQALLDPVPATAQQARADAVRLAPSPLECLLLEDLLASVYRITPRKEWSGEWQDALKNAPRGWTVFAGLLDLHAFATLIKGWNRAMNTRACTWVLQVLSTLLRKDLKLDPDGLLAFLDSHAVSSRHLTEYARDVFELCMRDVCDGLDQYAPPANTKLDPRLRLATMIMRERSGYCFHAPKAKFLKDLDAVTAAAAARGMPAVVARANALRELVTAAPQRQSSHNPFGLGNIFDDDDDDYDDDFEDDEFAGIDDERLGRLMDILATAVIDGDEKTAQTARAALLGCGITEAALDQAIQLLIGQVSDLPPSPRGKKPKPPPPGKPKPPPRDKAPAPPPPPPDKKPKPPPSVDPTQLELF